MNRYFSYPLLMISLLVTLTGCSKQEKLPLVYKEPNFQKVSLHDKTVFTYQTDTLFEVASTKAKASFQDDLHNIVAYAQQHPDLQILVQTFGGVDNHSNVSLRDNTFKSEAVASFLWQSGVDSSRIAYQGFAGGERLVAREVTSAGSALNRRIEISFMPRVG
ncbi:MAG: hypothetical protein VX112_00445 [Pseudomonadota bacterium]|nr:hypothetical protein [Pseudomonadota bacterium]